MTVPNNNLFDNFSLGLPASALLSLADYANVGIWNWHIPTNVIELNEPIVKLAGYEMYEVPHSGNSRRMMTFEDDYAMVEKNIQACISGEQDRYQIVYRMNRKDGSIVSVMESAFVCERDGAGHAVRLAAMVLDLSTLKYAEKKVQELETENRQLRKGMPKGEMASQIHLLRAANSAAAGIVGGFYQDYEAVLLQALKTIGESLGVNSMQVYRNIHEQEKVTCYLRSFWSLGQIIPERVDTQTKWDYDDFLPDWLHALKEGNSLCLTGDEIPKSLAVLPEAEKAKSMMLIPLYLHGNFWGLLRVDNWDEARPFTGTESDIAGAGVIVIASSISRSETLGKLNEAREEAMASTKAKSEFLSRMSHEIRTPLNAIIGMSAVARRAEDLHNIRYALDKIETSSRQLLSIINDVLDMSKIDSGKFEITLDSFDFDRMVQNVINVIQVKLDEKHQTLHLELERVFTRKVISDELRLSQVLLNLLGNAIKFTPDEGHITLKIRCEEIDDDCLRLHAEVIDTGVGISEEGKERLFNQFEQADNSISRKYGGTGLGLAISKKIVTLMNGDIWVESEEGKGATFIFEITAEWGDILPRAAETGWRTNQLRVLVVDDAQDVREYFSSVLESFSQICETAATGREALDKIESQLSRGNPYDIYFIDWSMPGMDGIETVRKIRELISENAIVVMISAADWSEIEPQAKLIGVSDFLSKPIMPSTIYDTLASLTQQSLAQNSDGQKRENIDWRTKTVLLAEDIEVNREIVCSLLQETGLNIVTAANGQEAVNIFVSEPEKYDMILMDVQMPVMDGLSATRAIRSLSLDRGRQIPIIAMTAHAFKEDQEMSLAAGMNGHISKPIELDILFDTLSCYLDR